MIREHKHATKISNNILKIETNSKFLHLAVNYQKGSEIGMEIYFMVKVKDIYDHFKLYEKYTNKPVSIYLKESESLITTIDLPPFCEEMLITVNYIGQEDDNSFVDLYPMGYKL